MSDIKHTPGPWQYKRAKEDNQILFIGVIGANGERVVRFELDEYGYGNDEEVIANAHLIAAAPELLEALKDAVFHLQGYILTNGHTSTMYKKTKGFADVIAKAQGKEVKYGN